jgi:hypothetical protein
MPASAVPAGIYGTIICASILASSDGKRPVKVAVVVIVTLVVYWLAERYAEVLGLASWHVGGRRDQHAQDRCVRGHTVKVGARLGQPGEARRTAITAPGRASRAAAARRV